MPIGLAKAQIPICLQGYISSLGNAVHVRLIIVNKGFLRPGFRYRVRADRVCPHSTAGFDFHLSLVRAVAASQLRDEWPHPTHSNRHVHERAADCKESKEMATAQTPGRRSGARQGLNSYDWISKKRLAGSDRAAKKYKLTSPLYQRPGYLLWRARHIADSIFTYECREFGVTSSQYVVLAVVKDTPGSDQVSVSRIAGLDRFTTALVLSNLIKRKLIVRERSASDRRRYSLRLSTEGFEILKRILPGAARARARLLSPLTRHDQDVFIRMLQQLVTSLNDDARAPVDEDALPNMRRKADRTGKKK
jgi:DNA-binding MarR family transcriptional regulator